MSTTRSYVFVFSLGDNICIIAKTFNGRCSAYTFRAQIPGYKSIAIVLLDVLSRERSTYNRENMVSAMLRMLSFR